MSRAKRQTITEDLISEVCLALREGKAIHQRLPFHGELRIDRKLPFLCLYRDPVGREDLETERLIRGEASFLIASAHSGQRARTKQLVARIVETLSEEFGSFLLLEVWADAEVEEDETTNPEATRPSFMVHADINESEGMVRVHESLRDSLKRIKIMGKAAEVGVRYSRKTSPPQLPSLLTGIKGRPLQCHSLGLAVQPIYRNPERGDDFPLVFRALRRGVSRALKRACFAFTRSETTHSPDHYLNLGPRAVSRSMWHVDRKLADIGQSYDFTLQVTPINIAASWKAFQRSGFEKAPVFHYRPLPIDPNKLKRQLYSINLERIDDPTLEFIFREKQAELDRQLTMLMERNTKNFLLGSLQLFGRVEESLVQVAEETLNACPGHNADDVRGGKIAAPQIASWALQEVRRMRETIPQIEDAVTLTDEVASMMVSRGQFLINDNLHVVESRARALIEHEVNTHLLTYWNARCQPLHLLACGLAGYDELQEGLAVLSEHLVGGLSGARLRILASRVLAAHCIEQGASFIDTFRRLTSDYEVERRTAFRITMRIFRSGGYTKDAAYLRGLLSVLDYLGTGGDIELLLIGKIARRHIPVIRELRHRNVLEAPALQPNYLNCKQGQKRLSALSSDSTLLSLVNLHPKKRRASRTPAAAKYKY